MALGVYCECGICLPVAEDAAGSSITCSCGRRVVVPLLDEFRDRPLLLSAATVERRVRRLIAEGVLPSTDSCLRCGDSKAWIVNVHLECEKYTARTHGGQLFLVIPLLWGFLWAAWREEERVEIRGRDTDVPAPIALCATCQRQLRAHSGSWYLLLTLLVLAASGTLAHFSLAIGIGTAAVGLILLVLIRRIDIRNWQRGLKALLRKVPVYRQVLERYPWAVIVFPHKGTDK
jgi:hypothetical protein